MSDFQNDKPKWETVHEIQGRDGYIARIQRLPGNHCPAYSYEIGRPRRDDPQRILHFISVKVVSDGAGGIKIDDPGLELREQAVAWINEDAQQHKAAYIEWFRIKERPRQYDGDRGGGRGMDRYRDSTRSGPKGKKHDHRNGANGYHKGGGYTHDD